jgi:hypothetical protein
MSANTDMKVISVLELEVIYSALKAMREDETISPAQAFQIGMDEWIR